MASKSVLLILSVLSLLSVQTVNGFTVELIHPDSPANPFRSPSKTRFDWIREAYNHTLSRAAAIQSRLDGSSKFKSQFKPIGGGYVMKYSIGTPPFDTYGIADTGSDVTWTQCKPCVECFRQGLPIFDPKDSDSYKTAGCDSDACSIVSGSTCSGGDVCQYEVSYGDQSKTSGDVATDTLTIGDASFKNVVFGCGHENSGTFTNGTSGIVGLGNSEVSILQQLDKEIAGKFAYCMSPESISKSYISFGADAVVKGPKAVSTPIYKNPRGPSFYWLSLNSITVGDKYILVNPPSTSNVGGRRGGMKASTGGSGNIIIDSGTTLTMVPSDLAYSLVSELRQAIPATPIPDPEGTFGLCYSTKDEFKVPRIVAHFEGADVELSPKGIFVEVEEGLSCLTIISDANFGISIFGNLSEVDHLVGYDLEEETVTFKPTDCSTV